MYVGSRKVKRRDSPWRVLALVVLIIGGLYVVREQIGGTDWTRPFDPIPTPTRSAESYFDEGEALYDEGLLDEAISAYANAFRIDPLDNVALFRLVRLMVFRGRAGEALEQYGTRLLDEELGDARTFAVLGMALDWHAVFNSEDLLPVYLELGAVEEEEVEAEDWLYSREKVMRMLTRASQKACEQALRLDADLPEGYAYVAEALADRERFEEAEAAAQTAVSLNPNIPDTQRALGYVLESQGEYELAVDAYQAAAQSHPKLSFLHIALGKNYRAIGYRLNLMGLWDDSGPYFEQAVAAFEEAIRLDPRNPLGYDEIGWTYGHYMGEDRELKQRAVDYLEDALNRDPEYAPAHRHLGQVYYNLQNYEECIPALERGLQLGDLTPSDAILSRIMLGWSYYRLDGDSQGEEAQCTRALPQFKAAWDILEELPRRELGLEQMAAQGLEACE
ncbi:MAG: tetratricopeptide repeat protein [Anaerolineae bacterium]|nr:tetratricopeptide repeat protein [Anaerolineae bacterium]